MADLFGQGDFNVRLDWGPIGAMATQAVVAVIVDVLGFSTSVTVAVERGMHVFPYRWTGVRAVQFAATHDAVLAVGRLEATKEAHSLRPHSRRPGFWPVKRSRVWFCRRRTGRRSRRRSKGDSSVALGCLRSARAVAEWLVPAVEAERSIAVIAAGERWSYDTSLRPALEDHLGAGAILSALVALGHGDGFSPEAWAAAALFDASPGSLRERMHDCVGGRELTSKGFRDDVDVAADLNSSSVVPVLTD